MSASEHGRPLGDLLGGLVSDISGLFRKEIELAKAEAGEKVDEAQPGEGSDEGDDGGEEVAGEGVGGHIRAVT